MYQTLLATQLLNAENPHCLRQGALNDYHDEDDGGLLKANQLPHKYNALDFRVPPKLPPQLPAVSMASYTSPDLN